MENKTITDRDRSPKYMNILELVKKLSIPTRRQIIDEIKIDLFFDEYDNSEVVINE